MIPRSSQPFDRRAFDFQFPTAPAAPRHGGRRRRIASAAVARPAISATILTQNSERLLDQVLAALAWCDEIVVLDTGSTDATERIARAAPRVAFHRREGPFPGFGPAHRQAVALARNDWILSIDSDEIVSSALAAEIQGLALDEGTVYSLPFRNYFNGRQITTCGWSPDRHERLFNRRAANFCQSEVHERVQSSGLALTALRQPVDHYSYVQLADFLRKMAVYSEAFARQNAGRKSSGPLKAVARSGWAFVKSYFGERGLLQGGEGLVISAYKAQTVFWKYLLLAEANRSRPR